MVGGHGTQAGGEPGSEVLDEQHLRFGSHFQGVVEEAEGEGLGVDALISVRKIVTTANGCSRYGVPWSRVWPS
ncbi:hypothetical protein SHKM778_04210 [Streptomyces sp. KM77-8]|uniref:Uncharacterized protein n=1 Tax=Streptomyces haneummycinicus TaxID=3074435 RepID=A0AAT9H9F1_9ACTN